MLSDEEREAKLELNRYIYGKNLAKDEIADYLGIIFALIEKQSKEIEELKEDNKKKSIVIIEYQDLYEKLEDKIKS